jgi:cell wall-associated NlpC family hydrolase
MRLDILGLKPIGGGLPDLPEVTDAKIRRFLDIALSKQGKRYVWGDEGPDSFDCSGFVHYCLNQAGYSVGRTTADGYSKKTNWARIEKNALQPGDIMFYFSDNPSDGDHIGHTGIYLGNGYHIHASSSNGCVIISQVKGWYDTMLSHGRRVNF